MTVFHLVRHGTTEFIGHTICGRLPGIGLNENGKIQAEAVADVLVLRQVRRVVSSPLERCMQTAQPLCNRLGLNLEISHSLLEINYGEWTGQPLEALERDPRWKQFNAHRGTARIPGGEMLVEVQARMVAHLAEITSTTEGDVAVFSHGDPI